jgi:hypothetical protein
MIKKTPFFALLLAWGAIASTAMAQNADDYRGGWRTNGGEPHTYEFSISGERVRGIYCTWCADATTLAFVDGTFGPDGLTFVVTHVKADGSTAYQDRATARVNQGALVVTGTSGAPGEGRFVRTLIKDPRGPVPGPGVVVKLPKGAPIPALPQRSGAPLASYMQPGPWKTKPSQKDVIGVWLSLGAGAAKQYFIIRKVGEKLRGMVCGTCDNPYTMAALDDFDIQGDTLTFNILHEDFGSGDTPTFSRPITAHVGWNELRYTTSRPARPAAPGTAPGASLLGPIPIEATAGNHWPTWPPTNTGLSQ